MVQLNETALTVLTADGNRRAFDSGELQAQVARCCLERGYREVAVAEDIAYAVERALAFYAEKGTLISEGEIDYWVVKILEESGQPEIADSFRSRKDVREDTVPVDAETARELFRGRLGVNGRELEVLVDRALKACAALGMSKVSKALLFELGRHYRPERAIPLVPAALPEGAADATAVSPWELSREALLERLSDAAREWVRRRVVDVRGVSRLFPTLLIDARLTPLAETFGWTPVVTEMTLFPAFAGPCAAVNAVIAAAPRRAASEGALPIYLRFPDLPSFAARYMGARFPGGDAFCRELAEAFAASLDAPVILKYPTLVEKNGPSGRVG